MIAVLGKVAQHRVQTKVKTCKTLRLSVQIPLPK